MSTKVREPSDVERGEWPDTTCAYVEHLEAKLDRIAAAILLLDPFNTGVNDAHLDRAEYESSQEMGERHVREAQDD